jgi:putative ABC transport system permease protein
VGLAYAATAALKAGGVQLPGVSRVTIDGSMLAFTLGASILCGMFFGLVPALRATNAPIEEALRSDTRGSVGARGQKLRSSLVLAEVALAVMLVVGAGLATKSFARLMSVSPGFRPEKALVASLTIGPAHMRDSSPDVARNYYYGLINAVAAVPGVTAAGSIRDLPTIGHGEGMKPQPVGSTIKPGSAPGAQLHHVSTDYFKAMGIPLVAGRTFTMNDRGPGPLTLIANEELVRRYWPGTPPAAAVGKMVNLGGGDPVEIIGVVGDVRQNGLSEPVEPALYIHVLRNMRIHMSIVARTQGDPLRMANAVRRAIWSVDPSQTIQFVKPLEDIIGTSVARQRVLAWLLGVFGLIGLTLGALGIYGVLAFAVAQRRKEIGVRVALGASPRSVMRLIVGRGIALATFGIVIGVAGARLLSQTMQSVLYGIQPTDAMTFVEVIVVLFVAALLASWLPARRALQIDPVSALRAE